jgi:hypothetical protein
VKERRRGRVLAELEARGLPESLLERSLVLGPWADRPEWAGGSVGEIVDFAVARVRRARSQRAGSTAPRDGRKEAVGARASRRIGGRAAVQAAAPPPSGRRPPPPPPVRLARRTIPRLLGRTARATQVERREQVVRVTHALGVDDFDWWCRVQDAAYGALWDTCYRPRPLGPPPSDAAVEAALRATEAWRQWELCEGGGLDAYLRRDAAGAAAQAKMDAAGWGMLRVARRGPP